jgi:hypothetical protein
MISRVCSGAIWHKLQAENKGRMSKAMGRPNMNLFAPRLAYDTSKNTRSPAWMGFGGKAGKAEEKQDRRK